MEVERSGTDKGKLPSYLAIMALYPLGYLLFTAVRKKTGRELPERIEPYDLVILGAATHKLSRIVTKEKVTDPIRATVTQKPPGSPVDQERPTGEGMRRVLGELLTCPFCMGSWIAAALSYAFVLAPRQTRFISTVFAIDAASDAMHCGFHRLKGS